MTTADRQIRAVLQLCIRRLSETTYNFVFIYEMVDGGCTYQEYELTFDQARAYFVKRGWPLVLPGETGRTVTVVKNGRFIGQYQTKERSLPDE